MHYADSLAFKKLEDLVNKILIINGQSKGNGRGVGGEKERKQLTSDDDKLLTSSARKHGSDVDIGENVSEPEESIWDQFINVIKGNTPKATKIVCQTIPENKPAHFGNEFHGSLSPEEAQKIVSQYEDGHYLVRESITDDTPCFALTFR
ncbi:beta-chimaerin-like [Stylophora pistillata]|uniref:beta-chimaerin-like n=1 Tax=Stylophora pistillata TaxID=50429 RepID=UPI000C04BF1D|nr:beta-chimaerin-like [Stylophora pistillata]